MTVELEDRLRTTFERVMPLLLDEPAVEAGESPESVVLVGSAARPVRGRRLLVAACAAIVIAMVAVIALVRDRDDVTPANNGPDTSIPSVPPPVTAAAADSPPDWYGWIKPFLPDGFDYVGVNRVGLGEIFYTAINRLTNVSLEIHIVRSSADELDDQPVGDVLETPTGYYINTTAGFQVDVGCGIGDVNANFRDSSVDTFDYCTGVSRAIRRQLTSSLAANFPFSEISAPDVTLTTGSTDLEAIRSLMESALADQVWIQHGNLLQGDTVEFGLSVGESRDGGTTATIIRGVYPPNDSGGAPDMYTYGDSAVGWVIRDGVGVRVLASHTGSNHGVLGTLLNDLANLVAEPDEPVDVTAATIDTTVSETAPESPPPTIETRTSEGDSPAGVTYTVQAGDVLVGIAGWFCVNADEVVSVNGWADGFEHALFPGDVIKIPASACVRGRPQPTSASSVDVAGDNVGMLTATGLASVGIAVSDHGKVSSGLVRTDFFDWPARLADIVSTAAAGAPVVFAAGGNDGQKFLGTQDPVGSSAWASEYTNRVLEIVDVVVGAGHPLIWIGVPDAADPALEAALDVVRDATEAALTGAAGVVYVDAQQILDGPDGGYTDTLPDSSGDPVVVRSADGFHVTPAGQDLVTQRVLLALQAQGLTVANVDPFTSYVVRAGDYLGGIATKTGTTVDGIIAANGWTDGSQVLVPGMKIRLPAKLEPPPDATAPTGLPTTTLG